MASFDAVRIVFFFFCPIFPYQISPVEFLVVKYASHNDFSIATQAISGISDTYILEPKCEWLDTDTSQRISLIKKYPANKLSDTHLNLPPLNCGVNFMFYCIRHVSLNASFLILSSYNLAIYLASINYYQVIS